MSEATEKSIANWYGALVTPEGQISEFSAVILCDPNGIGFTAEFTPTPGEGINISVTARDVFGQPYGRTYQAPNFPTDLVQLANMAGGPSIRACVEALTSVLSDAVGRLSAIALTEQMVTVGILSDPNDDKEMARLFGLDEYTTDRIVAAIRKVHAERNKETLSDQDIQRLLDGE